MIIRLISARLATSFESGLYYGKHESSDGDRKKKYQSDGVQLQLLDVNKNRRIAWKIK